MPLFHGKSKKDFEHNLKTEMHEGKPLKQSLAISYALKRRAKKAHGGMTCAHGGETTCPMCTYPQDSSSEADPTKMTRMGVGMAGGGQARSRGSDVDAARGEKYGVEHGVHAPSYSSGKDRGQSIAGDLVRGTKLGSRGRANREGALKEHKDVLYELKTDQRDRRNMAEGGMLTNDGYQSPRYSGDLTHPDLRDHEQDEYDEAEYNKKHPMKPDGAAMTEDGRKLGQHGEIEQGPDGVPPDYPVDELHDKSYRYQTDNYSTEEDGDGTDMVGRIMKQRQQTFSKGGRVANQDEIEAGFAPNQFDDLHLRDDLEEHYTGANSGDYEGDEGEDERRSDIVSRIMRSRRMRPGKNPNPA